MLDAYLARHCCSAELLALTYQSLNTALSFNGNTLRPVAHFATDNVRAALRLRIGVYRLRNVIAASNTRTRTGVSISYSADAINAERSACFLSAVARYALFLRRQHADKTHVHDSRMSANATPPHSYLRHTYRRDVHNRGGWTWAGWRCRALFLFYRWITDSRCTWRARRSSRVVRIAAPAAFLATRWRRPGVSAARDAHYERKDPRPPRIAGAIYSANGRTVAL